MLFFHNRDNKPSWLRMSVQEEVLWKVPVPILCPISGILKKDWGTLQREGRQKTLEALLLSFFIIIPLWLLLISGAKSSWLGFQVGFDLLGLNVKENYFPPSKQRRLQRQQMTRRSRVCPAEQLPPHGSACHPQKGMRTQAPAPDKGPQRPVEVASYIEN